MRYQLIMLAQPILVSANAIEGINPKVIYFDDKVDSNGVYRGVEFSTNKPIYNIILGINENRRIVKEIIAGIPELPAIDFSALSEEDCEKIGWVDVEKLADEFSNTDTFADASSFIEGFEVAQSLNEKKFSEEDVERAFESGWQCRNNSGYRSNGGYQEDFDSFIESIFQPKVFDVEVEMETIYSNVPKFDSGMCKETHFVTVPKITNNSIKVIKIL